MFGSLIHKIRNGIDDVGSFITGQPAHGPSLPPVQPQRPQGPGFGGFNAPPPQQVRPPQFNPAQPQQQFSSPQQNPALNIGSAPQPKVLDFNSYKALPTAPVVHNPAVQQPGFMNKNLTDPTLHAISGILSPVSNTVGLGINEGKAIAANVTHNPFARQNAVQGINQNLQGLQGAAQGLITRPAAEAFTSLNPSIHTAYHPGPGWQENIFGQRPIQNIETKVASNYNAHPNLNPFARVGLAGLEGVGSLAQDVPVASAGIKLGKDAIESTRAIGTNELGAVGKNINKPNVPEVPTYADRGRFANNDATVLYHGTGQDTANIIKNSGFQTGANLNKGEKTGLVYLGTKERASGVNHSGEKAGGLLPIDIKGLKLKTVNASEIYPKNTDKYTNLVLSGKFDGLRIIDDIYTGSGKTAEIALHPSIASKRIVTQPTQGANDALSAEKLNEQLQNNLQRPQLQNKQPEGLPSRVGTPQASTQESRALSNNSTPITAIEQGKFNPVKYVDEMTAKADAARKGEQPNLGGKVKLFKDGFREKFVDSMAPLEDKMNRAVKQGYKIPADSNLTYQIDRALRADTIGGQYIKDNGLSHTIQHVPDTKAFDQYLIAKHAADLEAQGIKTGRNSAKDAKLAESLAPVYEPHAQAIKKYTHGLLDKSVDYGLISPELASQLKVQYPNYVPFNRIFNDGEFTAPKGAGGGKASLSTQTVVQSIKGSNRQIESPLSNLVDKTQQVINQGERNKAAQILASYKDMPGNPFELRELKPGETIGNKPTISHLDNGVKRTFETSKEVAEAAKGLNKEQIGVMGKVVASFTRLLRLGATGINPAFAMANVVKDFGSAFINSSHPFRTFDPEVLGRAAGAALHHGGENYQELVREGAAGTSFDIARNAPKQNIKLIRADKNVGTKALYKVTHPSELLRAVENTIGRSEEFGRALQYYGNKKAFKIGNSESDAKTLAAHAARNNTVNFSRAGSYGRVANLWTPYLNAGIQGSRTLLRNLRNKPVQTSVKIGFVAFAPMAITTQWNLSDPERKKAYDNISEYEKQNNIIIVPPHPHQDASGRWNVIKIPMSQEIANLTNIVRTGIEQQHKDGKLTPQNVAGNVIGTTTSLNAQNPTQLVGQLTPQIVKPGTETILNKNLFTGQAIVPDALKNLQPQDQKNKNTSGTAVELGKIFGISPMKVDNAIKTATGGLGQNLINLSDKGLATAGVIKQDDVKGKSFLTAMANRFNSAQGQTPGSEAFSLLQDEAKNQHLVGKGYDALNMIKSRELDANGNPVPTDVKTQLENAAARAADPKILSVETAAAKRLAAATGKPASPFYTQLSPDQQKTVTVMQAIKALDPENAILTKMKLDNASWLAPYNEQSKAYWNDKNAADGTKVVTNDDGTTTTTYANGSTSQKGALSIPTATPEQSAAMQGAKGLAGADYVNYQKAHPELKDYYTKYDQAVRRIHDYWNEPQYKGYPAASDRVNQLLDGMPQGNDPASKKARALVMKDPEVSDYTADIAMWQLNKGAALNQFEGQNYNQKDLKNISSIGRYDIMRNPDGSYSQIAGSLSDGTKLAQSGQAYTPANGSFAGLKGLVDAKGKPMGGGSGHGGFAKHKKNKKMHIKYLKHFSNAKVHHKSPSRYRLKFAQHKVRPPDKVLIKDSGVKFKLKGV